MRHKVLATHPGVFLSFLIVAAFLGSAQGGAVGTRLIFPDLIQAPSVDVGYWTAPHAMAFRASNQELDSLNIDRLSCRQ